MKSAQQTIRELLDVVKMIPLAEHPINPNDGGNVCVCSDCKRARAARKVLDAVEMIPPEEHQTTCSTFWMPIETAPRDGGVRIMIASILDGEIKDIDFDAIYEQDQESWEIPQTYWIWRSAHGRVEEPTHWAPLPSVQ